MGTYGPEAVALAKLAGLHPDPWQSDSVDLMLSYKADKKWACFEYAEWVPRQNGKGAIAEVRALAGLFLLGEKQLMWSAHLYPTAKKAFIRMDQLIKNLEMAGVIERGIVKTAYTNGEQGFLRTDTGQRLEFLARTKGTGRGWTGDTLIWDESFGLDEDQQAAQLPALSAVPNPQIVYTSTPPLDGHDSVPMYELRARAERGEDVDLGYRDWGVAEDLEEIERLSIGDRKKFLADESRWIDTNPGHGFRLRTEFIAKELQSMTSKNFARERLGAWPRRSHGGGEIDVAAWAQMLDTASKCGEDVAIAFDVAPKRDYTTIVLFGIRPDTLGHVKIIDYRPGTEWLIGRLVELKKLLNPIAIGVGARTYDSFKDDLERAGIAIPSEPERALRSDLLVIYAKDASAACGQVLDAVKQQSFCHVGQAPLDSAVSGAQLRQTDNVVAWVRKDTEADMTPIAAMTFARWAYMVRYDQVKEGYDGLDYIF